MYLLIKQSPEHRQWDVQHQNPQHHLDLLDETFLSTHRNTDTSPRRPQPSNVTRHMAELIAFCYRVLLLSPVQPVWPLRLELWPLPASLDGKLQDRKWTFQHITTQKLKRSEETWTFGNCLISFEGTRRRLTPTQLQTCTRMFPWGGTLLYRKLPVMNTTAQDGRWIRQSVAGRADVHTISLNTHMLISAVCTNTQQHTRLRVQTLKPLLSLIRTEISPWPLQLIQTQSVFTVSGQPCMRPIKYSGDGDSQPETTACQGACGRTLINRKLSLSPVWILQIYLQYANTMWQLLWQQYYLKLGGCFETSMKDLSLLCLHTH